MKTSFSKLRNAAALAVIMPLVASCVVNTQNANTQNASAGGGAGHTTVLVAHPVSYNDPRSNDEISTLLPASAFSQSEFPKPMVVTMMRVCINRNHSGGASNPVAQAGRIDQFCGCKINKDVHNFTMSEYIDADKQRWDASKVPDAAHKNSALLSSCMQSALK